MVPSKVSLSQISIRLGDVTFSQVITRPRDANLPLIEISLEDYKGKWLILGFIPMAWTFVWYVASFVEFEPYSVESITNSRFATYSPTEVSRLFYIYLSIEGLN